MSKVALVVLAGTEGHSSLGRVVNALEVAREYEEDDDGEAVVIFDGAGTEWIPELRDPEHPAHEIYESVKHRFEGACRYCAKSFEVFDEIQESDVDLLADFEGHPSIKSFVDEGYEVVTF